MKKISCIILVVFLSLILISCKENKYSIILIDNEYGSVISQTSAKSGDEVELKIDGVKNYQDYDVYVNGVLIEGNTFIMPEFDVEVVVSLSSNNDKAYNVIIEKNEYVQTISNLSKADVGDRVTLTSYASFNTEVLGYLVDGEKIYGNEFTMPNKDVIVEVLYDRAFDENGVAFSVESYYHFATSYWSAKYTEDGIVVDVCVDDDILFTSHKATNGIGMRDNVELICGLSGTDNEWDQYIKLLVSADGEYYWQRRFSDSWVTVSESRVTFQHSICNFNDIGFNGYRVIFNIPYAVLNTTYEKALGNITLLPAMRNTLNVAFTGFGFYDGYGSTWDDHTTHPILNKENQIVENIKDTNVLFVGDQNFANYNGKDKFKNKINSYKFLTKDKKSISYWQENIETIKKYNPKQILFAVGDYDLLSESVVSTFKKLQEFVETFKEKLPDVKLTLVSAIPTYKVTFDYQKTLAYNKMLADYALGVENVEFLDITTDLIDENRINSNLYSSSNFFSEAGYRYLTYKFNEYFNLDNFENVNGWGHNGNYIADGDWTISDSLITCGGDGTCVIYNDVNYNQIMIEAEFKINSVNNKDSYPKFGYSLSNNDITQYYYVDASNSLKCQDVSIANCIKGVYDFSSYSLITMEGLDYTAPEFVKLKLIKLNEQIIFIVNEQVAFNIRVGVLKEKAVLGLFSFNLNMNIENINIITDKTIIMQEMEAVS